MKGQSAQRTERILDVFCYLFIAVMFLFFAVPLLWLVSLSLRDMKEVYLGVARFIPENPTLDNYRTILTNSYFPMYLWNGLKLSCLGAVGCLAVAAPAAYAFSRFRMKAKGVWLMALLAFQMISPLVIMVPLYRYMSALNLIDTHFSVVMVYIAIGVPLATWLLKGFIDGIPRSLDEAALIDGCNRFSVFWRIILPLSGPGIASAFIITVIAGWSQFLVPYLLLTRDDLMPIAAGIFNFAGTQNASTVQVLAAACLVSVLPAIVVFLSLQRLILGSIMTGAVKG